MTARLIFHLGDHKTGSTSIQNALLDQGFTSGASVFFPSAGNHNRLARTLMRGAPPGPRAARLSEIAGRLAASDADIGVISAERFEAVEPAALARAIEEYFPEHRDSARLIAYVRPHAERVLSSWAERIKGGYFTGTLAEFHARTAQTGAFVYTPRFSRWRETFGARFELRPMIREQLRGGDVVEDFLAFALEGHAFRMAPQPARNESLSLEDLSILHAFQTRLGEDRAGEAALDPDTRNMAGWRLAQRLSADPAPRRSRLHLPRDLAAAIVETYRADAAALDAAFFEGTPMTAALAAAPARAGEGAQSVAAADHFGADALRQIRVWSALAAEMLKAPGGRGRRAKPAPKDPAPKDPALNDPARNDPARNKPGHARPARASAARTPAAQTPAEGPD